LREMEDKYRQELAFKQVCANRVFLLGGVIRYIYMHVYTVWGRSTYFAV
jgi:hypothetical protein